VQKIRPGLWRWTALHPEWTPEEEWGEEVGCLYQETEDAVTLIDPLIPPEDSARFLEALDRDVARSAAPGAHLDHDLLARAERGDACRAIPRNEGLGA
jgi:hypothetical protein